MRIRVLGGLEVKSATGEQVVFAMRKTSLVLAALVLAGARGVPREALCEAFWPDRGAAQARGSLRQALVEIRRAFPANADGSIGLGGNLDNVELSGRPDDVDLWRFDLLLRRREPASLAAAADLYQGDLLAGATLPESLDAWFTPHQRAYRRSASELAEALSLAAPPDDKAGQAACERLSERLLAGDPTAEEPHRALIRLYQRQGRRNAARRQFELCRDVLRRELGVEPEERTCALLAGDHEIQGAAGGDGSPREPVDSGPLAAATTSAPDGGRPSVVVMPFDNLSGGADDYFVDGVVEEITATLSRVRDFFVIARQSAFTFKGRFVDPREIGKELGVAYLVEGTVRRAGDRVRISVQLVDAQSRAQLWSDRLEGATTDIFEFQDRIAAQVAGAIQPAVLRAEIDAAKRRPPGNLRAYELVLQAYPKLWCAIADENRQAIALLTEAVAVDAGYGRAHALLSWCHSQDVVYLWSSDPDGDRERARRAVAAALGLIGDDPMAMTAVGATFSQCLGDQDRAAIYIEHALALDPNNAWAWARSGWLALYRDQPDQARAGFERALTLSPLDPLGFNFRIGIAVATGFAGDYPTAARLMRDVLNEHPQVTWAYRQLAAFAALAGDLAMAREAIGTLLAAHPNVSVAVMKASHPGRHLPRTFNLMLEGWRLAGLPEG